MVSHRKQLVLRETVALALLVTLTCTAISWGQASPAPGDSITVLPSSWSLPGWIFLQSAVLAAAVTGVSALSLCLSPSFAKCFGTLGLLLLPIILIADAITFGWIGERFLSLTTARILTEFRISLLPFVTRSMWFDATFLVAMMALWIAFIGRLSKWIAGHWPSSRGFWAEGNPGREGPSWQSCAWPLRH